MHLEQIVVKSKLPPRSGSSLEAVEPYPEKGAIKFFQSSETHEYPNENVVL